MTDSTLRLLKGTLDVLILKTVSWGPAHGYAISRWIRESSDDHLVILEGALYPALRRLEEQELLASEWRRVDTGREARVYTLTPKGRQAMREEVATWHRYVAAFTRILETRPREALS